jgi:dynein heavy chain
MDDFDEEENDNSIFKLKDVDTFIQMIREHKLSPMEFIYLIKPKMSSNDAYNMRVVEYHLISER